MSPEYNPKYERQQSKEFTKQMRELPDADYSVVTASRQVIERKLLDALDGDAVAILATKSDLELLITALAKSPLGLEGRDGMLEGLKQLHREAFSK